MNIKGLKDNCVLETASIIVKLNDGNCYQVALTDEMIDTILYDLAYIYFGSKKIQVIDTPLEMIDIKSLRKSLSSN